MPPLFHLRAAATPQQRRPRAASAHSLHAAPAPLHAVPRCPPAPPLHALSRPAKQRRRCPHAATRPAFALSPCYQRAAPCCPAPTPPPPSPCPAALCSHAAALSALPRCHPLAHCSNAATTLPPPSTPPKHPVAATPPLTAATLLPRSSNARDALKGWEGELKIVQGNWRAR